MDCTRLHSSGKQCTIDSVAGSNGAGGADSTKMGPVAFRVRVEDESYNQIRSSDIRRGSHVHQHGHVRQRHQLQRRGRRQRQGLLPELQAESRRSVEGPGTGLHRRNRRRSHGGDRGIQHLRAAAQVGDGQVQRPHPVPGQRPGRLRQLEGLHGGHVRHRGLQAAAEPGCRTQGRRQGRRRAVRHGDLRPDLQQGHPQQVLRPVRREGQVYRRYRLLQDAQGRRRRHAGPQG